MATPTCGKCKEHSFETTLHTPLGEAQKLALIQCSGCGAVVGVLDRNAALRLTRVQEQVSAIEERLTRIAQALSGLS